MTSSISSIETQEDCKRINVLGTQYKFSDTCPIIGVFTRTAIVPHLETILMGILMLPSHLGPDLPSALFPSGLLTKISYAFLISPNGATCNAHFTIFHFITLIISDKKLQIIKLLVKHSSPFSSLLDPNTPPSNLF